MSHECPRDGCTRSVEAGKLMCRDDWARVPEALKRAVYAAWNRGKGRGSAAHREAILAAIRSVNGEQEPPPAPKPSPHQLWEQAGEDPGEYRRLMREHGHLIGPGDEGCEDASRSLPCGWPRAGELP